MSFDNTDLDSDIGVESEEMFKVMGERPSTSTCDEVRDSITLQKGSRSCTPIGDYGSYHHLSPSYLAFLMNLSSVTVQKVVIEVLNIK